MEQIDCRGMQCPKPVILTKKALDAMKEGSVEVIVDNVTAKENVSKLAGGYGYKFEIKEHDGLYNVTINKTSDGSIKEKQHKKLVILVGSDKLGSGDDELGTALMKSYLYALTENDIKPEAVMFVNSGAKLTVDGSDVLETIKSLECQGVEILTCGMCLDFYKIKDKLKVGSVSNMYAIVEKLNSAENTIKL